MPNNNNPIYTLPDYAYADGVVPKLEDFENYKPCTIDWKSNAQINQGYANGQYTQKWDLGQGYDDTAAGHVFKPGMAPAAEGSAFLAEVVNDTLLFDRCQFVKVTRRDNKYVFMGNKGRLQALRNADGKQITNLNQRTETQPGFRDKVLTAEAMVSFTEVPWTMIEDNLLGGTFMQAIGSDQAKRQRVNAQEISLNAIKKGNTTDPDGLNAIDGLWQQLTNQYNLYKSGYESYNNAQGIYCGIGGTSPESIDFSKTYTDKTNPITQMQDMNTQYGIQLGSGDPEFWVSKEVYGLLSRIAGTRPTPGGDGLYFSGQQLFVDGTPVIKCDALGKISNGWKQHIILGNMNSYVHGMREDFKTNIMWHQEYYSWIMDTAIYFGTLLLYEQDILAAECSNLPSQTATTTTTGGSTSGSGGS